MQTNNAPALDVLGGAPDMYEKALVLWLCGLQFKSTRIGTATSARAFEPPTSGVCRGEQGPWGGRGLRFFGFKHFNSDVLFV